jgi:hypothetical protein
MSVAAQPQGPALHAEPPMRGEPPPVGAPPPGPPVVPDVHVSSADLGFQRGVGPAPGQTVTWRGTPYLVIDATANGGRPTFSGGSRFVITSEGGTLKIGLKAIAPGDAQVAAVDTVVTQ